MSRINREQQLVVRTLAFGTRMMDKGKLDLAIKLFRKSQEYSRRCDDSIAEAKALRAIGEWHQARDEWDESLDVFHSALGIVIGRDESEEAHGNLAIGLTQVERKELELALSHFEVALSLFRKSGNLSSEANAHFQIGLVRANTRGQLSDESKEKALRSFESAAATFHESGDEYGKAMALLEIGLVHSRNLTLGANEDEWQSSLNAYKEAVDIFCEFWMSELSLPTRL